ncbi:MAG: ABC-type transport auxiliary lipoprotein family protein [Caulobacter sp.]|nr:ABC-type transport auxiliary lipoprotein family protein [Caulobacter sp.]
MTRRRIAIVALALAAVGLSGCISLFPKAEPAQLYRLQSNVEPRATPAGPVFGVLRLSTGFPRAAAGDRILTVNPGGEAAYIAGARWVSPAAVMFEELTAQAFQGGGRARLIIRGDVVKADYTLKLDVHGFETVYDRGAKASPLILVSVRGVITRSDDRTLVGDRTFTARVRASDNRISAIVPAYDTAVSQVLGELVGWVNGVDTGGG